VADLVFEWDAAKARGNLRKHRVSFVEAVTVFGDRLAAIHDDPDHSVAETRELIVGHSSGGRLLIVSFTERANSVRIIGARRVTAQERRDYEARGKD
jgi:uncharacterized protein